MKLFISWSGELSHQVALVFRDWLPSVIQSIVPYVSSEDIEKGARWSSDISLELQTSGYGILCVTGENISAPWLNFEAGALSKAVDASRVSPFLFGIKRREVSGPLLQFQSTVYEKEDVKKLVLTLNHADTSNQIPEKRLEGAFEVWWPHLQSRLDPLQQQAESDSRYKTEVNRDSGSRQNMSSLVNAASEVVSPQTRKSRQDTKIFIVHGHDEGLRESVARFVERQHLAAIVLLEQPNLGQTIIEKFEQQAKDVDYAIILLTPDDLKAPVDTDAKSRERARQNVILELGFFIGQLGRGKVCLLHKGNIELPSDILGVLFIRVDDGGAWRLQLARDMKGAGLAIDLNNIY